MSYVTSGLLLIAGSAIGSFLNVVAMRFKEDGFLFGAQRLGGRSHCPYCGKQLKWYELVPILSFLVQLGRCHGCGRLLSLQYPLVEAISAFIFFLVPYYFFVYQKLAYWDLWQSHPYALLIAVSIWILVFVTLLLLAVIDFREYLVPDELIYILFFLGIAWVALSCALLNNYSFEVPSFLGAYTTILNFSLSTGQGGALGGDLGLILRHISGALVGSLVIAAIFFLSRGRAIGFGDVKLLGALGLLFGFPEVLIILMLSFILGALSSCALLIRKLKGFKDFVPFAPFLAVASFIVFFWGEKLLQIYFNIFKLN